MKKQCIFLSVSFYLYIAFNCNVALYYWGDSISITSLDFHFLFSQSHTKGKCAGYSLHSAILPCRPHILSRSLNQDVLKWKQVGILKKNLRLRYLFVWAIVECNNNAHCVILYILISPTVSICRMYLFAHAPNIATPQLFTCF